MTMDDARDSKPELYGMGGWLAFLCVSLLLFAPLTAIQEVARVLIDQTMEPVDKVFAIGFVIVALGFAVFAGIGLGRMWRRALIVAKGYFFLGLSTGLLITLSALLGEASAADTAIGVQTFAVSAAWLGYLFRSERVRNTYGENTVRDAAEVFK